MYLRVLRLAGLHFPGRRGSLLLRLGLLGLVVLLPGVDATRSRYPVQRRPRVDLAAHARAEHGHVGQVGGDVGHPARLQRDDLVVHLHAHGVGVGEIVGVGPPPGEELGKAVDVGEHARGLIPHLRQFLPGHLVGVAGGPDPGGLAVVGAGDDLLVDPVQMLHADALALGGEPVALLRGRAGQQVPFLERGADVFVVFAHRLSPPPGALRLGGVAIPCTGWSRSS